MVKPDQLDNSHGQNRPKIPEEGENKYWLWLAVFHSITPDLP